MSWNNAFRVLQKNLYDYSRDSKKYEVLDAVLQARSLNTSIVETDLNVSEGKNRTLKINYYAPDCDVEGSCSANVCEAGTEIEPRQAFFTISQCTASKKYTLSSDNIRKDDGNFTFSQHALFQVRAGLNDMRGVLASDVAALLAANVGLLPDGNSELLLPFIDKTNGYLNPMGYWEIQRQYREAGYSQDPFVVGASDVFYWKKAVGIGGMNERGQNAAQMGANNLYYDTLINTAFADNTTEHVFAFDPQMLKFVSWNKNAGMFATERMGIEDIDAIFQRGGTDYVKGVLRDPVTGLLWDLYIKYDFCTDKWTWYYELNWDIFFMPPQVCNIAGVNGLMHFTTCVPLVNTCQAGSPVVPASADTFESDTNGVVTFPTVVTQVEVGGITYIPATSEQSIANITALRNLLNSIQATYVFAISGTKLTYSGYAGITVQLNNTTNLVFTT